MEPENSENRLLPLSGGCNFRDLGGYATSDGRRVKWRMLYRSGAMDRLTAPDLVHLRDRGFRGICDFRSTDERLKAPTPWEQFGEVHYWSRDHEHSIGDLNRLVASASATLAEARAVMSDIYRRLPFEQESAYRQLFTMLAQGDVPLVFNCSAGKDRTGIAAALVLMSLGVAQEQVVQDYELSNAMFDYRAGASQSGLKLPGEVIDALGGTHPDYLAAAFSAIAQEHGDATKYISDRLGVTPTMLDSIHASLLE